MTALPPLSRHQEAMIDFHYDQGSVALLAPPGFGKSRTYLEIAARTGDEMLIVAPKLVAATTFPAEVKKWGFDLSMRFLSGREKHFRGREAVSLINYENMAWAVEKLKEERRPRYKMVVLDELSKMKNHASVRAKAFQLIRPRVDYVVGGTGTPVGAHLKDLFGEVLAIDGGRALGNDYERFLRTYFSYDEYSRQLTPYHDSEAKILGRLRDTAISFDINDLDMPELTHIPHYLDIPADARAAYVEMHEESAHLELELYAVNAAVRSGKLRQMASGGVIDIHGGRKKLHSAKAEHLRDILEENDGRPVLVFFEFLSDYQAICDVMGYEVPALYGKTRARDAQKWIGQWNAGKLPLLAGHPRCVHPSTLVLTEYRGWVPIVDVRTTDRVWDGVEFVQHEGCQLSGKRAVIDLFGIKLTPDHPILINDKWVEARYVRDSACSRRKALHGFRTYREDGAGAVSDLRPRTDYAATGRGEEQHPRGQALSGMPIRILSPHDKDEALLHMEGYAGSHLEPGQRELRGLWRTRAYRVTQLAHLRRLLARYAGRLRRRFVPGAQGQLPGIFQAELPMGDRHGAARQQAQQPHRGVPGSEDAFEGVLPRSERAPHHHHAISKPLQNRGCGPGRLRRVDLSEEPQEPIEVYDLVNCGPRHRFAVCNADGEVFIVHNSAGYGVNLQNSGNVVVFYSTPWSYELVNQSIARLWRQGQKNKVRAYFLLVKNTEDERVFARVNSREDTHNRVMKGLLSA